MSTLNYLAGRIHVDNILKGFWDKERNFGELIALIHSEVSEALEAHREGQPNIYFASSDGEIYDLGASDIDWPGDGTVHDEFGVLKPDGIAIELADALIRILDLLASMDVDIDEAVDMKLAYNRTRPEKHGKAY